MTHPKEAVEWPDIIWAEDRDGCMMGAYRLSAEATVGEELEHAEYVHRGVFDSLKKYHDAKVAELRAAIDQANADRAVAQMEKRADDEDCARRLSQLIEEMAKTARADADKAAAVEALIWCSGSQDFAEGGVARNGWLKLCAPIIRARGDA